MSHWRCQKHRASAGPFFTGSNHGWLMWPRHAALCQNILLAYLQRIHSTRSQQLFWRKGCGVRWRRGPTAAGCQNSEMLVWSPAPTWDSAWWTCPPVTGRLCGFKVLGDCYRYSSSRAWWRAMRSEWLETLQKGMACCGGADNVVRTEDTAGTSPGGCSVRPLTHGPPPLFPTVKTAR